MHDTIAIGIQQQLCFGPLSGELEPYAGKRWQFREHNDCGASSAQSMRGAKRSFLRYQTGDDGLLYAIVRFHYDITIRVPLC